MIFAETSDKTRDGIAEIFLKSTKETAKNMNENYYDLTSEICGIKKESIKRNSTKNLKVGNAVELQNGKKEEGKKCC